MIDENKNVYYLITAFWTTKSGKMGSVRFLSKYSMNSRKFKKFKSDYFASHLGIKEKRMNQGYEGTINEQRTISRKEWKEVKDVLLNKIDSRCICQ